MAPVVALIEADGHWESQATLLEDLVYSEQLPRLIDSIEELAQQSERFRRALVSSRDALGGRGGPEVERIFKLIDDAEWETPRP